MDRPLGRAIGNAHEVRESLECLRGGGPSDLREMVLQLAMHPDAARVLDDGSALACFARMVEAQGGDPRCIDDPGLLRGSGTSEAVVCAPRDGFIAELGALEVGRAAVALGAGRIRAEDPVDHGVGMDLLAVKGEPVETGQPLVRIAHRQGVGLERARALLEQAFVFSEHPVSAGPLILGRVGAREEPT